MDVLLVEDERLVRESAAALLRDAGLAVAEAASAEEAVALAETAELREAALLVGVHVIEHEDLLAVDDRLRLPFTRPADELRRAVEVVAQVQARLRSGAPTAASSPPLTVV